MHRHRERNKTEKAKALRMVQEELKSLGWTKAELERRRQGGASRLARACFQHRRQLQWIAERLGIGGPSYVSNLLPSVDRKL